MGLSLLCKCTVLKTKLLVLLFIMFAVFNVLKSPAKQAPIANKTDTLTPFHLIFYYGDERVQRFEINVYKKLDKYYADNISPLFYVGNHVDSTWSIILDKNKIMTCIKFIKKARSLGRICKNNSSSVIEYEIASAKDTIRITGNCDWNGLDFFALREILFRDRILNNKLENESEIRHLNSKLIGKWYFIPLVKELKNGASFNMTKTNNSKMNCFWEFGNGYSFRSTCNDILDFTNTKKYEWHLEEGNIYLIIREGAVKDKNGNTSIENDGATFKLDSIIEGELKLLFQWR